MALSCQGRFAYWYSPVIVPSPCAFVNYICIILNMNHHSYASHNFVILRVKTCVGESRFLRHDPQVVVKQTDKVPEGKCPFNFDAFFVTLIQLLWPRAVLQYNWSLWLTRSQITYKAWFLITWILPALLRWMYSAKMDVKPSWTTSFVIWWKLTFGVLGPSSWYTCIHSMMQDNAKFSGRE